MSGNPYLVQCNSGNPDHVMEVVPGTELEARCKVREEKGFLNALCLDYHECPGCIDDSRRRRQIDDEYFAICGCPMAALNGDCDDDCGCKNREEIVDSPYRGQLRPIG